MPDVGEGLNALGVPHARMALGRRSAGLRGLLFGIPGSAWNRRGLDQIRDANRAGDDLNGRDIPQLSNTS